MASILRSEFTQTPSGKAECRIVVPENIRIDLTHNVVSFLYKLAPVKITLSYEEASDTCLRLIATISGDLHTVTKAGRLLANYAKTCVETAVDTTDLPFNLSRKMLSMIRGNCGETLLYIRMLTGASVVQTNNGPTDDQQTMCPLDDTIFRVTGAMSNVRLAKKVLDQWITYCRQIGCRFLSIQQHASILEALTMQYIERGGNQRQQRGGDQGQQRGNNQRQQRGSNQKQQQSNNQPGANQVQHHVGNQGHQYGSNQRKEHGGSQVYQCDRNQGQQCDSNQAQHHGANRGVHYSNNQEQQCNSTQRQKHSRNQRQQRGRNQGQQCDSNQAQKHDRNQAQQHGSKQGNSGAITKVSSIMLI